MRGSSDYNFLTAQMSAKRAFAPVQTKRGRCTDERTTAAHQPTGDAPM